MQGRLIRIRLIDLLKQNMKNAKHEKVRCLLMFHTVLRHIGVCVSVVTLCECSCSVHIFDSYCDQQAILFK